MNTQNTQKWMSVKEAAVFFGLSSCTLLQRKCINPNAQYFKKEGRRVYVDVANFPTTTDAEREEMETLYFELLELLDNRTIQVAKLVSKKIGITASGAYMYFNYFKFKKRDTYVKYYAAMQEVLKELKELEILN